MKTIEEIKKQLKNGESVENVFPKNTDEISDGFHSFEQLYYQRMILFSVIVKQNKNKSWKSWKHDNGELCFHGDCFVVGIDTPQGQYTYHYFKEYWNVFDCKVLDHAPKWDGHTEKDVTRLLSLAL